MTKYLIAAESALVALVLMASIHAFPNAFAQNATGTQPTQGPPSSYNHRYFEHGDHGFYNHGGNGGLLGLGVGIHQNIIGPGIGSGIGARANVGLLEHQHDHITGYGHYLDFARQHHNHFLYLNNRFVLLPSTIACPAGTQLLSTGECGIVSQAIVEQQAPTILSEQVQTSNTGIAQPEQAQTSQQQETITTTQQSSVAPTITCPEGSVLVGQECQASTTTLTNVAPLVSCPAGTLLTNGACIQQQQQITVDPLPCPSCPAGATLVNGQCTVTAMPSQVTQGTTSNEIIVFGHHFVHPGAFLPYLHYHHWH